VTIAEPLPANPEVDAIVRKVEARIDGVRRWEVERIVIEELVRFEDSRVTAFIPILVERAAVLRLRHLHLAQRGSGR
jgi:hypothetical protein